MFYFSGVTSNMASSYSRGSEPSRAPKEKVYLDRLVVQSAKGILKDATFNEYGQPIGPTGAELQSCIGVCSLGGILKLTLSFGVWCLMN